ncbi:hypothetical protein BDZ89DRAFT_1167302 [Hymenopellis radicata]|nr:hypothetical protein BDZ89DRAFT_1167302 [Hymenopellis radicata]
MSDDSTRISIAKLNDSNYGTRSMMIEALLTSKELFTDIVEVAVDTVDDKGDPRAQSDIDAEIEKKLKKRSKTKMAQARSEMILRVEPSQLSHMRDKDPLTVWEDLKSVHRLRGFTGSLVQRKKLLLMKMKKGQSMLVQQLPRRTRFSPSPLDFPAAYKSVISTFNATSPKDLTLDFVTTQLLNEEASLSFTTTNNTTSTARESGDVAMAAYHHNPPKCYLCDGPHLKRDCPNLASFESWKKGVNAGEAHVAKEMIDSDFEDAEDPF